MKYLITFLLCLATIASAQDAHVVQLSPQDTAQAQELTKEKADILKKIDDFNEHIKQSYLQVGAKDKDNSSCLIVDSLTNYYMDEDGTIHSKIKAEPIKYWRNGWCGGDFTFSTDYKYIVPTPKPASSSYFNVPYCTAYTSENGMLTSVINQ